MTGTQTADEEAAFHEEARTVCLADSVIIGFVIYLNANFYTNAFRLRFDPTRISILGETR